MPYSWSSCLSLITSIWGLLKKQLPLFSLYPLCAPHIPMLLFLCVQILFVASIPFSLHLGGFCVSAQL